MKKLKLNVPERLVALGVFNNPETKVATSDLKIYLDDVGKFALSEEYKKQIKWKEVVVEEDVHDGEGKLIKKKGTIDTYHWNEEKVDQPEFQIEEFTRKLLQEKLEALETTAGDQLAGSYVSLLDKIK